MSSASSTHRPAVKVTMATPTRVRSLIQQASDLEVRLEQNKSNDKEKQRLRSQLCETLSDILLSDPQFAMSKDCCGRLWRTCFYSEIGSFRNLIYREKKKKGLALATYERAQKKFLQEAMDLYNYLITSYQEKLLPTMTISQSQGSLATVDDSQEDQTTCLVSASPIDATTSTAGVVEGLHRLLIHLGDLNRYAENFPKAEACYGKAAKLAPGKGNPYNQLAVVAQLKDPASPLNCVALYWYTRSLLATEEPFMTSLDNLKRLLESNRQSIPKISSDQQVLQKAFMDAKSLGTVSKKDMHQAAKALKTAASKLFLIQFVDLHYDFFTGVVMGPNGNHKNDNNHDPTSKMSAMVTKMKLLLESFRETIQNAAFSDSLLCKMVTINAFSVLWPIRRHSAADQAGGPSAAVADATEDQVSRDNKKMTSWMAHSFALTFGAILAERLEQSLGKILDSHDRHGPEGIPPVRLLLPLVLTLNFLSTLPPEDNQNAFFQVGPSSPSTVMTEFATKSADSFWPKVVTAANLLAPLQNRVRGGSPWFDLQEIKNLRGFAPFRHFTDISPPPILHDSNTNDSGFVNPTEAMEALTLDSIGAPAALSSTQESVASAGSASVSSPEESKSKILHFLELVDQMTSDAPLLPHPKLVRSKRGFYSLASSPLVDKPKSKVRARKEPTPVAEKKKKKLSTEVRTEPQPVADNNNTSPADVNAGPPKKDDAPTFHNNDDKDTTEEKQVDNGFAALSIEDHNMAIAEDEGGDVLVYKVPEGGQGPALLVPGSLLLNLAKESTDSPTNLQPPPGYRMERPREAMDTTDAVPMEGVTPVELSHYFEQVGDQNSTTNNLMGTAIVPAPAQTKHPTSMDVDADDSHAVSVMAPPRPVIVPPPGFGGMSNVPLIPLASRVLPTTTATNHPPPDNFGHRNLSFGAPGQPSFTMNFSGPTVGDSFPWFGSGMMAPPTSNPFFSSPAATATAYAPAGTTTLPVSSFHGISSSMMTSSHFLDSDAATAAADGTSLLDSGLLSSLWMDDNITGHNNHRNKQKNPFAAT